MRRGRMVSEKNGLRKKRRREEREGERGEIKTLGRSEFVCYKFLHLG